MSGRRKQDCYQRLLMLRRLHSSRNQTKGEHHAYCKSCNCDISISDGGANDIKRHMNNDKHKKNADSIAKGFFTYSTTFKLLYQKEVLKCVCRAEVLFTWFFSRIFNPTSSCWPHFENYSRQMFPVSMAHLVYKFTVTEVEVRSIILTFFAVYFSMYKLEVCTPFYKCKYVFCKCMSSWFLKSLSPAYCLFKYMDGVNWTSEWVLEN